MIYTDKLVWQEEPTHKTALLGSEVDGVRFTITVHPTCYRRGPFRLLVEVLGGPHRHDWGCFDEQDQPMRYYHQVDSLLNEAQEIAKVLYRDRLLKGPIEDADAEAD